MSVVDGPKRIRTKYSRLGSLRAHCDRQTLGAVHLPDMISQVPRVLVDHFGILSLTVTTEDLASGDVKHAFGRPVVFVSLVSTRHLVDRSLWTELIFGNK